jgi:hypothetical protein
LPGKRYGFGLKSCFLAYKQNEEAFGSLILVQAVKKLNITFSCISFTRVTVVLLKHSWKRFFSALAFYPISILFSEPKFYLNEGSLAFLFEHDFKD